MQANVLVVLHQTTIPNIRWITIIERLFTWKSGYSSISQSSKSKKVHIIFIFNYPVCFAPSYQKESHTKFEHMLYEMQILDCVYINELVGSCLQ